VEEKWTKRGSLGGLTASSKLSHMRGTGGSIKSCVMGGISISSLNWADFYHILLFTHSQVEGSVMGRGMAEVSAAQYKPLHSL